MYPPMPALGMGRGTVVLVLGCELVPDLGTVLPPLEPEDVPPPLLPPPPPPPPPAFSGVMAEASSNPLWVASDWQSGVELHAASPEAESAITPEKTMALAMFIQLLYLTV